MFRASLALTLANRAVFDLNDEPKGQLPLGLVVLSDGCQLTPEAVSQDLIAMVREQVGAVACFRRAVVVQRLPKTRSGKILRRTLRELADGEQPPVPSTIDDPAILEEIDALLKRLP